jgi:CheY-like chemotaxis protein
MTDAGCDACSRGENDPLTQCSGRPECHEPAGAIQIGGVPINGHADLASMRCLLVDDNQTFLEVARACLDREGITVAGTASNTAEALRQARALRPDLVLVDIALGHGNGFDLARRLAGNSTAVIMISSAAEADYADLIAESPASGFLSKAELSAAGIRRILARGTSDAADRKSPGLHDVGSPSRP